MARTKKKRWSYSAGERGRNRVRAFEHAVDWRFHVVLVLAHETGHRIGAIGRLLWSDVDFENRLLRWRDATDKNGRTHVTPMTNEALEALEWKGDRTPLGKILVEET